MTPEQIALLRLTFAQLTSNEAEAGRQFYARFFALAPDARAMFKDDVGAQTRKLMHSLGVAMSSINNPGGLSYILQGLGRRHVKYGVLAHHYEHFRSALLWMLETRLGEAFTPAAREAWDTLYGDLANEMQKAGAKPAKKLAVQ
jgi:hemoglobin-like flavoprotein